MASVLCSPSAVFHIRWSGKRTSSRALSAQGYRYAGIDLGTSNSAIAVVDKVDGDGIPRMVPVQQGQTIPTVVYFAPDGTHTIGREAVQLAQADPDNSVRAFKRMMGAKTESSDPVRLPVPNASGGFIAPQEAAKLVLASLIQAAQSETGDTVDRAVVCVPSDFGDDALRATIAAANDAGLKRCVVLQEPVAAAMAHGLTRSSDEELVLVFDLGGGTCDVSLLDCFEGIVEVIATAGDRGIGGTDMDRLLAERILSGLSGSTATPDAKQLKVAEQAKIALSEAASVEIDWPSGEKSERVTVTRNDLEEALAPLLASIAEGPLSSLAEKSQVDWAWTPWGGEDKRGAPGDKWAPPPRRVTQVVLVGAATKTLCVRALLERMTGVTVSWVVDPEHAVAMGAAVQAAVLEGQISGVEVMDGTYNWDMHQRALGFS